MQRAALPGTIAAALAVAAVALGAPADAQAQREVTTGGLAVYIPDRADVVPLAAGQEGVNDRFKGVVITDDPASPLYLLSQNCAGTNLVGAETGEPLRSSGYCVGWDADGDLFWMSYWNGPDGGEWTVINGTGKFEGMTGGGTSELVRAEADGRFTLSWRGTLMMR
jgi:hypothetical protein